MRKLMLFAVLLSACVAPNAARQSLLGEWQLKESLIDIGDGKGTWSATAAESSVSFFDDGKLWSDDPLFAKSSSFELKKDSITLRSSDTSITYYFQHLGKDSFLIRPRCIEACGYKYVRLK